MIIKIKHCPVLREERKKKLAKIDNHPTDEYISYEWSLKAEDSNENIYDLQLFSLSITKNLLEQKFFSNEFGPVSNDIINEMKNLKETIENIRALSLDIQKQKLAKNN